MNNLSEKAMEFFASEQKLLRKKSELENLANSPDGEKIKGMLDEKKLMDAAENGDMETLKSALDQVLRTQEGARLAGQLSDLLK